jgi:ribonuclease G
MRNPKHRKDVEKAFRTAVKSDRARTKILGISRFGLVEMTRKRTGETISEIVNEACPYCQGRGMILSPESVSIQIERELRKMASEVDDEAFLVTAEPEVAEYLIGAGGQTADHIEKHIRRAVYVRSNRDFHIEKYEILPGDLQEIERRMLLFKKSQIMECEVVRSPFISLPRASAWSNGYMIDLANGGKYIGQRVRARLTSMSRSLAEGEVIGPVKAEQKK